MESIQKSEATRLQVVFDEFGTNPAEAQRLGHGSGGVGTSEGVQDVIPIIG